MEVSTLGGCPLWHAATLAKTLEMASRLISDLWSLRLINYVSHVKHPSSADYLPQRNERQAPRHRPSLFPFLQRPPGNLKL